MRVALVQPYSHFACRYHIRQIFCLHLRLLLLPEGIAIGEQKSAITSSIANISPSCSGEATDSTRMGQKPLPTQAQFLLSTSLLLVLSFCLAPFSALACFIAWAHERLNRNGGIGHDGPQKTVLVNGAKMYKSLGIVRALGKAGCRVIVCESGT